jgi:hypothetical protein
MLFFFIDLIYNVVDAVRMCLSLAAVVVCGFGIFWATIGPPASLFKVLQSAVALIFIMYFLTPVLASLARPISDDTVGTLVGLLLTMHLFTYDYFCTSWQQFHSPVSSNSGLLSAIFLCSRMHSYFEVFAVVALGLLLFSLWPIACTALCPPAAPSRHLVLAAILCPLTFGLLLLFFHSYEPSYLWTAWLFLAFSLLLSLFAPLLFHRLQPLRHVLQGQWTEVRLSAI